MHNRMYMAICLSLAAIACSENKESSSDESGACNQSSSSCVQSASTAHTSNNPPMLNPLIVNNKNIGDLSGTGVMDDPFQFEVSEDDTDATFGIIIDGSELNGNLEIAGLPDWVTYDPENQSLHFAATQDLVGQTLTFQVVSTNGTDSSEPLYF